MSLEVRVTFCASKNQSSDITGAARKTANALRHKKLAAGIALKRFPAA
jgi:hypothetical protein